MHLHIPMSLTNLFVSLFVFPEYNKSINMLLLLLRTLNKIHVCMQAVSLFQPRPGRIVTSRISLTDILRHDGHGSTNCLEKQPISDQDVLWLANASRAWLPDT